MLKVPAPIRPAQLKRIAELRGWHLLAEDEWNWSLSKDTSVPITIPKDGEFVPVDIMMDVLHKIGVDTPGDYFMLRDQSAKDLGIQPN